MNIGPWKFRETFERFSGVWDPHAVLHISVPENGRTFASPYRLEWIGVAKRARIIGNGRFLRQNTGRRPQAVKKTLKARWTDLQQGLPFDDGEFDWVDCEMVLEHLGPLSMQRHFVEELYRISRKGCFIATSNRWHPFEFHTGTLLWHWLPKAWWRPFLKHFGKDASDANGALNLLSGRELKSLAAKLPGSPQIVIEHFKLGAINAVNILEIRKTHPN